eukprot:jgi/Galph1/3747/GphlegSOOS_G2414.1
MFRDLQRIRRCHTSFLVCSPRYQYSLSTSRLNLLMGNPREPSPKPPINLPSGLLLATSCFLAIATVGSIFELSSGHPQYGSELTTIILTVALPGFLFLFYAAIQKAREHSCGQKCYSIAETPNTREEKSQRVELILPCKSSALKSDNCFD